VKRFNRIEVDFIDDLLKRLLLSWISAGGHAANVSNHPSVGKEQRSCPAVTNPAGAAVRDGVGG
jgi:hypothetical protein